MRNKRKALLISSVTAFALLIGGLFVNQKTEQLGAEIKTYSLTFNSEKNKLHDTISISSFSGDAKVKTDLDNDINFTYYDVKGNASSWHVLGSSGYFYNTTPITGIISIELVFGTDNADYTIEWSEDQSFNNVMEFTSISGEYSYFNFNDNYPSYFKLTNTSGTNLNIKEMIVTYTCYALKTEVSVTVNDPKMGSVKNVNGFYIPGTELSTYASSNNGYYFVGWFIDDVCISDYTYYDFIVEYEKIEIVAKFAPNTYNLSVFSEDESIGTVTGSGEYLFDSEVTIQAFPNEGYCFDAWYDEDGQKISTENPWTFKKSFRDQIYTAKFLKTRNIYLYSEDDSRLTVHGPSVCAVGKEVVVTAVAQENYALKAWCDENYNEVSYDRDYAFIMPDRDVTLYATITNGYTLTLLSENEECGELIGGGQYREGQTANIKTKNAKTMIKGWVDENNNVVSTTSSFTFTMPGVNCTLKVVVMSEEEITAANAPVINLSSKKVSYGLYPKDIVTDENIIDALEGMTPSTENNWYLLDNKYYTNKVAKDTGYDQCFLNNEKITVGKKYWFACEPIAWKIIYNQNNQLKLLSEEIIDAQLFIDSEDDRTINGEVIKANNYEHSLVRQWLNGEFFESAFALNNESIVTITNSNTYNKDFFSANDYALIEEFVDLYKCNDTQDRVCLLSLEEYHTSEYGFSINGSSIFESHSNSRLANPTNYALVNGLHYSYNGSYNCYETHYITRSPMNYADSHGLFMVVTQFNTTTTWGTFAAGVDHGIRPSITISY